MDQFKPKVVNPRVVRFGRRYSLVHRPGSYLINDTRDPNAEGESFSAAERALALRRYRQLEAGSRVDRLRVPRVRGRAMRMNGSGSRWRLALPVSASVGVIVAGLLLVFAWPRSEPLVPERSVRSGVDSVLIAVGSGDPPREEREALVEGVTVTPGATDRSGQGDRDRRADRSSATDSDVSAGSSVESTDSSTVQGGGAGDTSDGGSGSGDSTASGGSGGDSTDDPSTGPGGAGPGGGSGGGGDGGGSGGGGGGGG